MARIYADKIKVMKDQLGGWVAQFYRGSLLVFTMSPAAEKHADIFVMTGMRVSSDSSGDANAVRKALATELGKAAAKIIEATNDAAPEFTPELRLAARTLAEEVLFRIRNES